MSFIPLLGSLGTMYKEKKLNEKNARTLPRNLQSKWLSSAMNEQRLDEWAKVDTKAHYDNISDHQK